MARHPQVRIDLALDDRPVDPVRHAFDLSLRIRSALDDSEFMSRRIGGIAHVVCVARDYPTRPPQRPGDRRPSNARLCRRPCAHPRLPVRDDQWPQPCRHHPYHPSTEDEQQSRDPRSIAVGRWRRRNPALRRRSRPCRGAARSLLAEWRLPDYALFALFTGGRAPPAKLRIFLESWSSNAAR